MYLHCPCQQHWCTISSCGKILCTYTYTVHIDTIGVGPARVIGLRETGGQLLGDVVETDELLDALLHLLVLLRTRVQAQHDG